jgi:DUF971 family protein
VQKRTYAGDKEQAPLIQISSFGTSPIGVYSSTNTGITNEYRDNDLENLDYTYLYELAVHHQNIWHNSRGRIAERGFRSR